VCDGSDLGGKSCSDFVSPTGANYDGGTLKCSGSCNAFDFSSCHYCGDGVKNDLEACDDGNTNNNDGCSSTCALESCGDGIIQAGEECDDGTANNGWGQRCSSICTWQNCTINSINITPTCYNGALSNNAYACTGGNGFDATVNFTGTNCSKSSYVQIDLTSGTCDATYIGGTSGLSDVGSNFISTPANVGNNIYNVHFSLAGSVSDACAGKVLTNYVALLRGGVGTPPPSRSKDIKTDLLNKNITLSQCALNSYTTYDKVRFFESPPFVVLNATVIANTCDKFLVKNAITTSSGTANLQVVNNSVVKSYTCGVLDGVCPDDFAAASVCGYDITGLPNDPDCGTHVWEKCANVTLNDTPPFTNLGSVTCVPSTTPSNTHRACLDAGGCMYYDGNTMKCYARNNVTSTANGNISCSIDNVWCIPNFAYSPTFNICKRVTTGACDEGFGLSTSIHGCGTLENVIASGGLASYASEHPTTIANCLGTDSSGKYTTFCSPSYSWGGYYFYDTLGVTVK
jgi:cysteine-rich repeat protein